MINESESDSFFLSCQTPLSLLSPNLPLFLKLLFNPNCVPQINFTYAKTSIHLSVILRMTTC